MIWTHHTIAVAVGVFVVVSTCSLAAMIVGSEDASRNTMQPHTNPHEEHDTPNFVLLLLDDHGYGDMGAYDSVVKETPQMDALASSGILFRDFHSAASLCTPSRAALLTGRLGMRTGVTSNFGPTSKGGIPTQELTIAELLPTNFKKHMIGKWHLGHKRKFHPSFRGFDTVYGLPYSGRC